MLKAFKTELRLTERQKDKVRRSLGICRFLANQYIARNPRPQIPVVIPGAYLGPDMGTVSPRSRFMSAPRRPFSPKPPTFYFSLFTFYFSPFTFHLLFSRPSVEEKFFCRQIARKGAKMADRSANLVCDGYFSSPKVARIGNKSYFCSLKDV